MYLSGVQRGEKMSYRILLVEDDRQIREVIEDYFSAKGSGEFELVTAKDGEEGQELIQYSALKLLLRAGCLLQRLFSNNKISRHGIKP